MTSACGDEICRGCAADEPPPKLNGTGDPVLARMLAIAGPDDARASADILTELATLAADRAAREVVQDAEQRTGALWDELRALRDAVAAGEPRARELLEHLRKMQAEDAVLPSAAEHTEALLLAPPVYRVPSGMDTVDRITDGGWMGGKIHVIAGEADIGKTSILTQGARYACEDGRFVVGFHVADVDDRTGILQRFAQSHNIDPRAFQNRDRDAILDTARILRRWPNFHVIDEDEDDCTLEESAKKILAIANRRGKHALLFVDSLQTAELRWRTGEAPRNDREQVDKVLKCMRHFARRGLTIITTCEVPRSVYGGPRPKALKSGRIIIERPPALAAFKHSGKIEYALWTGLVLTRIKDDPEAVRVEVPKNKQGRKDLMFRLVRSASRVGFDDMGEMHDKPEGEARPRPEGQAEYDTRLDRAAHLLIPEIIKKLAAASKGLSGREIRAQVAGAHNAKDRAITLAVAEGAIVTRQVRGYDRFFSPSAVSGTYAPQASFAPEPDYPIPED